MTTVKEINRDHLTRFEQGLLDGTLGRHRIKSSRTIQAYVADMTDLEKYATHLGVPLPSLEEEDLAEYFSQRGYKRVETISRKTSAFSLIIPLGEGARKRIQLRLGDLESSDEPLTITEGQFSNLLGAVLEYPSQPSQYSQAQIAYFRARDAVMTSLLFRTGLNVPLVRLLDMNDLLYVERGNEPNLVRVDFESTKFGEKRYEVEGKEADILKGYREKLAEFIEGMETEPPLFLNMRRGRVSDRTVRRHLVRASRFLGMPDVTPRVLRKSYIKRRLGQGATHKEVKQELGLKGNTRL